MKSFLINIKNFLPYLILILIYFFFVNIEARKELKTNNRLVIDKDIKTKTFDIIENKQTIPIEVIPYQP